MSETVDCNIWVTAHGPRYDVEIDSPPISNNPTLFLNDSNREDVLTNPNRQYKRNIVNNLWEKVKQQPTKAGDIGEISDNARKLGDDLFTFLLGGDLADEFDKWGNFAWGKPRALRFLLHLDPALYNGPWEYLWVSQQGHLCQRDDFSVVRVIHDTDDSDDIPGDGIHEGINEDINTQPLGFGSNSEINAGLKVLVVVSNPNLPGHAKLNPTLEVSAIEKALQNAQVEVLSEEYCTFDKLRQRLLDGDYQIVHYIGHSGVDPNTGSGIFPFRLAEDAEQYTSVTAIDMANQLRLQRKLRLLVLTSCASAVSVEPLSRSVPAIVAMQQSIADRPAADFSRSFYTALSQGQPIDLAVQRARGDLHASVYRRSAPFIWGAPTLWVWSSLALEPLYAPDQKTSPHLDVKSVEVTALEDLQPTVSSTALRPVQSPSSETPISPPHLAESQATVDSIRKPGHDTAVSALAFATLNANTTLLTSGSRKGDILLWKCSHSLQQHSQLDLSPIGSPTGHTKEIFDLCLSSRGTSTMQLISAGRDGQVKICAFSLDLSGKLDTHSLRLSEPIDYGATYPQALVYSNRHDILVVADSASQIHLYRKVSGRNGPDVHLRTNFSTTALVVSVDDAWIAATSRGQDVLLWLVGQLARDSSDMPEPSMLPHHVHAPFRSSAFVSNNDLITITQDGSLRLWTMESQIRCLQEFSLPSVVNAGEPHLAWLRKCQSLVVGTRSELTLWRISDQIAGQAWWSWNADSGERITCLAASPGGEWFAAGLDSGDLMLFSVDAVP